MDNDEIPKSIMDMIKPRPFHNDYNFKNEHAREEEIMNRCFESAGIFGEDRAMLMYDVGKRIGIYEKHPCDQ